MTNNHPPIQFKKERELGEVLSDTFAFIRQNFKSLFTAVFKFTWPAFALLIISLIYYMYSTTRSGSDFFSILSSGNPTPTDFGNFYGGFFIGAIVLMVSGLLYYSLLYGTIQYYIKSYIENNGNVNFDEIATNLRENWKSFLILSVITSILIFIGAMLCLVPGVYLMVPFSLVFSIKAFDKLSLGDTISHCFTLIKDNWWITFLTLLLVGIVYYLINLVFQIPLIIYTFVKGFTMAQEGSASDPFEFMDYTYLALSTLSSVIQYLLYIIITIATVFIYFNLNEKKNHSGTFETIDTIGKQE